MLLRLCSLRRSKDTEACLGSAVPYAVETPVPLPEEMARALGMRMGMRPLYLLPLLAKWARAPFYSTVTQASSSMRLKLCGGCVFIVRSASSRSSWSSWSRWSVQCCVVNAAVCSAVYGDALPSCSLLLAEVHLGEVHLGEVLCKPTPS